LSAPSHEFAIVFSCADTILTNTGIFTIFYSKHDPYAITTLLGIQKNEYDQLRALLKVNPDVRNCLISVNGQLSLLRTNDFPLDLSQPFDLSVIQNLPFQRQLRSSYQQYVFDPIDEILSQK
jgi:hypothetical protein